METFVILSHKDLFRGEPSWEAVDDLLRGVATDALITYAANFCHRLTYGDALGASVKRFQDFQRWFLEHFVPDPLRHTLFGLLGHRRAYRGQVWALADPHRVANLVAAHLRANPAPPPGKAKEEDMERLARAQLMVNDLVSVSGPDSPESLPAAQVLKVYAMAQRPSSRADLPRAFDLFAERLPQQIPDLDPAVRSRYGVGFSEILLVLVALTGWYLWSLDPEYESMSGVRRPPWTGGVIGLAQLSPDHPGDCMMRRVYDLHSADWATLRGKIMESPQGDAGIRQFLRRPFLRLDNDRVWCFDPGLLLSAATDGLFWLGVEAMGGGARLLQTLGGVFEDYIHDLFQEHGCGHVRRGDLEGQGLPDFFWLEGGTLVVVEAKASVMRDEVKWAANPHTIEKEFSKILKDNQLSKATRQLLSTDRSLAHRVSRVVPVFVVRDPCFASPGLESLLNDALDFTSVGSFVEDAHLLNIAELENAIPFVRDRTFTGLLSARRKAGGFTASVSVAELLANNKYRAIVRRYAGKIPGPLDVLGAARERLNERMGEVSDWLSPGTSADGKE